MKESINLCFLLGNVVSPVEFKFFYNSRRHVSQATCWLQTIKNSSFVRLKGYDEMADEMYKNLNKDDMLRVIGHIEKDVIVVDEVNKQIKYC